MRIFQNQKMGNGMVNELFTPNDLEICRRTLIMHSQSDFLNIRLLVLITVDNIKKPELALSSVLALKRVTRECRFQFPTSFADELVDVMRKALLSKMKIFMHL